MVDLFGGGHCCDEIGSCTARTNSVVDTSSGVCRPIVRVTSTRSETEGAAVAQLVFTVKLCKFLAVYPNRLRFIGYQQRLKCRVIHLQGKTPRLVGLRLFGFVGKGISTPGFLG